MTNVFFSFCDSLSNPLVGSKVILRPYTPPYYSGSSISYGGPSTDYTDTTGSVYFNSVIPGIYKISFTNAGANNPATLNVLQNYANTVFYVYLPETSGSLINGANFVISPGTGSNFGGASTASYANIAGYAITAGTAISASWAPPVPSISASFADTASYSFTASFALNATAVTSSVSASYSQTSSISLSSTSASVSRTASCVLNIGDLSIRSGGDMMITASDDVNILSLGRYVNIKADGGIYLDVGIDGDSIYILNPNVLRMGNTIAIDENATASHAKYADSSSFAKYAQAAGVAFNLDLVDVTTVNQPYDILMWDANDTYGNDQALIYNPFTRLMVVTASSAISASISKVANKVYTEEAAVLGDMYPFISTVNGPANTQVWNTHNVRINPGAGRITATEVSASLLIGTASYATSISKSQVGPITITDMTNVATLYLVGDSGTGGHLSTIAGSPSGLNFDVQTGDFIGIGGPLHIGDHDIVPNDGKFLGTASYATPASYALNGGGGGSWSGSSGQVTQSIYSKQSLFATQSLSASYVKVGTTTIDQPFGVITTGQSIRADGGVNVNNNAVNLGINGIIYCTGGVNSLIGGFTGSLMGSASYSSSSLSASVLYNPSASIDMFGNINSRGSASVSAIYNNNPNVYPVYWGIDTDGNIATTGEITLVGNHVQVINISNVNGTASFDAPIIAPRFIGTSSYAISSSMGNGNVIVSPLAVTVQSDMNVGNISASVVTASFLGNLVGSASYATSASYAPQTSFPTSVASASWVSASAFITTAQTASYYGGSIASASYAGTASVALNAVVPTSVPSASWVSASAFITTAQTASFVTASKVVGVVNSASYAYSSVSASYAPFTQATQTTVASASWVSASVHITNADTASFALSANIITASYISQSIYFPTAQVGYFPFWSGSYPTLTTSSLLYTDGTNITASGNIKGTITTASYASTASVALNATVPTSVPSASWVSASVNITTAYTASYVLAANVSGKVSTSTTADTASYVLASNVNGKVLTATTADTASYFITSSVTSASLATTASFSITSSFALNATSYVLTASDVFTVQVFS